MDVIQLSPDAYIRHLELDDAEALFRLTDTNRTYLRQWLPWVDSVQSVRDTARFISLTIEQALRHQGYNYGIWYKGKLAGTLGVHGINWANRRTTIGYWLGERFQGKGLMTDAVAAYIDHLIFGQWDLNRVEIAAATENRRSRAIPERLGFQLEGIIRSNELLRDHFVDHAVYGLLAAEWKQK
jgi:ribosomal-protein-serine acetyltransferase